MDDLTQRYYEAEMRYLREAGKEFAQAYPDRAAMLNLDKPGARDPYVERLFEGFAFLMGRLREKLDDDLPELTEGLVSLLWPHYLRTIPSLSVVELVDRSPANEAERNAERFSGIVAPCWRAQNPLFLQRHAGYHAASAGVAGRVIAI